jgi:hypothetical protein
VDRWGWRNAGVEEDEVAAVLDNRGKFSAGREATELEGREVGGVVDELLAILATRSRTWRDDCWDERAAVEFLALRTRPEVIPA